MTIDQANDYDIREPMQVRISLQAMTGEDISVSVRGEPKISDVESAEEASGEMVVLADLQGEGFLLDGTANLLDSAYPSGTKLGIRGNIGEDVVLTVAGYAGSTLSVSAVSGPVLVDGVQILSSLNGVGVIPVTAGTAITFQAPSTESRVEIDYVVPGVVLFVTNEILQECVVSLRSDLSILNPTLPGSEINFSFWIENDIKDQLATVPDEVPITYSAGYADEMSPERKFYLAEQITQEGHVVTIHGQDAVHKLEADIKGRTSSFRKNAAFLAVYAEAKALVREVGIELVHQDEDPPRNAGTAPSTNWSPTMVLPGRPRRDFLANWMMWLRQEYGSIFGDMTSFYFDYVDAGRPSLRWHRRTDNWTFNQADCGSWTETVERKLGSIIYHNRAIVGITTDDYRASQDEPYNTELTTQWDQWIVSVLSQPWMVNIRRFGLDYIQYAWKYNADVAAGDRNFAVASCLVNDYDETLSGGQGITGELSYVDAHDGGSLRANSWANPNAMVELYPGGYGAQSIFRRSNKSGTFTFKGDPRMQPRDYAEVEMLDGTTKAITLEELTITHRAGGTSEEVKYREGWI